MKLKLLLLAALLFTPVTFAQAQDEATPPDTGSAAAEPAAPTVETLLGALDRLAARGDVVLTGMVGSSEPESDGAMAGMKIVIGGGGGGGGKPFSGGIEVWRTADNELLIVSRSALPGIGYFDDGDRTITQLCYEERPVETKTVTADLSGLLDLDRLKRAIRKGDLAVEAGGRDGGASFAGTLSTRAVREPDAGSPMAIMAPRVLRVEAEFIVGDQGDLEGCRFTVVRSDPMAGIRRKAASGGLTGGGGEIQIGMPEVSDDEGKSDVYTLRVSRKGPSKRARLFRERVRALTDEEAF